MSLHQKPELDFKNDGYTVISEDRARSKYFFADPNVIVSPPEKEITLPTEDVCFQLSTTQLDKLIKAAAVYQVPDLSVIGEDGHIDIVIRDKKNDTSNHFSVRVGETVNDFVFNFNSSFKSKFFKKLFPVSEALFAGLEKQISNLIFRFLKISDIIKMSLYPLLERGRSISLTLYFQEDFACLIKINLFKGTIFYEST